MDDLVADPQAEARAGATVGTEHRPGRLGKDRDLWVIVDIDETKALICVQNSRAARNLLAEHHLVAAHSQA